ncbi:MAG: alkaline phosphatase [Dysgonamonadaceae bacterium]|jgi:alkaline phosphatase|nr:alkaline phosphatase [Dysgonamonadaceae bacterium]
MTELKKLSLIAVSLIIAVNIHAQEVKNVIFMVPDGTSIPVLSLARWVQYAKDTSKTRLSIDPYLCGLVKTHSSNAPIGDSAPTMSAYMTGCLSQTGFLSMYPPEDPNDLTQIDNDLFPPYSPRMTVMEAARIVKNKAIGLVVTCEFPHATPGATSSHWNKRNDYKSNSVIQQQMVNNSIDVVIGSGKKYLSDELKSQLRKNGYEVPDNLDTKSFKNINANKFWALFGDEAMSYDWDRNPELEPSLAEMTEKAINTLSKSKNGFFLMVEGSKIDWASHKNDPVGIVSEMLAFDAAVKKAIEFAKSDGNTVVVICPDHGNGGISVGNAKSEQYGYDRLPLATLVKPLLNCNKTTDYIVTQIAKSPKDSIASIMQRECNMSLSSDTIDLIGDLKGNQGALNDFIIKIIQSHNYIGFTTHGHTAEDVFLAIYHPKNKRLGGLVTAPDINNYLCKAVGLKTSLNYLTNEYYQDVKKLFNNEIVEFKDDADNKSVEITLKNNAKLKIQAYSNLYELNGKQKYTKTPAIYVGKTSAWYVSKEIKAALKNE